MCRGKSKRVVIELRTGYDFLVWVMFFECIRYENKAACRNLYSPANISTRP